MANIPETSTTLLRELASDSQHVRWREFVARYRPMMESYMHERFPSVDIDDIVQNTLIAVCAILPSYRYCPEEKGSFHNYLTGILRNKALRFLREEERRQKRFADIAANITTEKSSLYRQENSNDQEESWRMAVFELAKNEFLSDDKVADRTKRIFERIAINGEDPELVAESFKMKRHAVDQAKSRAIAKVREIVEKLMAASDG